jgi:plastocyanin
MTRITLSSLIVCAAAAVLLSSAGAATPFLHAEVGPGFKIEVEKAGKDVKRLKAGRYMIKVEDKASIHNFHLIGPGVNKKTTAGFVGKKTWTVTLKPGKYTYRCDPHAASGMRGSFRVFR